MADTIDAMLETLGFVPYETEGGGSEFTCDIDDAGNFATLTDMEGLAPTRLQQSVLFTYYTADGSFKWSTSFKSLSLFTECWEAAASLPEKVAAVEAYRRSQEWYKDAE